MKNYIDGQWVDSSNGKTLDKLNPSTGELLDKFPASTKDDVDRAIDAAESSYEAWYNMGSVARGKIIREAGDRIKAARSELENILIKECGKVKVQAAEEVDGVLDQIYYYSEFARKITGDIVEGTTSKRKIFQYKVPHGVVVALTPWNFPAAMVARKLAPALLTGNSVVIKPSSDTPLTAEWIVRKFVEAGIPKGVLNLITGKGSEIGDYIVAHRKVGLITMTGSTETGQRIIKNTSANMAKTILELGGKAPFIVWKDADLENAARALIWAKFWNAGQSCIAAERVYVHSEVKKKFMDIFLKMTGEIKVGDPQDSAMGPLINKSAVENMNSFMAKAREEKLQIVAGGKTPDLSGKLKNGFFFEPTIIDNVPQNSPLFQEEIFGPVVGVHEVKDREEMFKLANDSKYGLASYLFTSDMNLVYEASERIRFGEVYVNMPGPEASQGYHTGFRMTGQAGEGSKYGIEEYLKLKNVYVDYSGEKLKIGTVPGF